MNNKLKDDNIDFLFRAILELETVEDCYDFFEDLCTVQELKTISQRIVVAKMLFARGYGHNYIMYVPGASRWYEVFSLILLFYAFKSTQNMEDTQSSLKISFPKTGNSLIFN